jgi:sec-independent protein translocase protein TatB
MFGIDFSEILVIFFVALAVLGPQKLPKLAQTVGRWVGRARSMARQFREQLEQEAEQLERAADLKAHMKPPSRPAPVPPAPVVDTSTGVAVVPAPSSPPVEESHERGA